MPSGTVQVLCPNLGGASGRNKRSISGIQAEYERNTSATQASAWLPPGYLHAWPWLSRRSAFLRPSAIICFPPHRQWITSHSARASSLEFSRRTCHDLSRCHRAPKQTSLVPHETPPHYLAPVEFSRLLPPRPRATGRHPRHIRDEPRRVGRLCRRLRLS